MNYLSQLWDVVESYRLIVTKLSTPTLDMCHAMSSSLAEWNNDLSIKTVVIDHADGRGFCAGGDINLLRNSALNDNGVSGKKVLP